VDGGDSAASAKIAPQEVLKVWDSEWAKEGVEIEWEKLLPPKGFEVLPRRWVVERTFAWLGRNRRMSKDYERLCETSETLVLVTVTRLMVSRLVRV
jgi:putative transposase